MGERRLLNSVELNVNPLFTFISNVLANVESCEIGLYESAEGWE